MGHKSIEEIINSFLNKLLFGFPVLPDVINSNAFSLLHQFLANERAENKNDSSSRINPGFFKFSINFSSEKSSNAGSSFTISIKLYISSL